MPLYRLFGEVQQWSGDQGIVFNEVAIISGEP